MGPDVQQIVTPCNTPSRKVTTPATMSADPIAVSPTPPAKALLEAVTTVILTPSPDGASRWNGPEGRAPGPFTL